MIEALRREAAAPAVRPIRCDFTNGYRVSSQSLLHTECLCPPLRGDTEACSAASCACRYQGVFAADDSRWEARYAEPGEGFLL